MSMGLRLTPAEVKQRLADCEANKYDPCVLGELWGLQEKTAAGWMRENCRSEYYKAMYARQIRPVYNLKRIKPEYENQKMFDMQVLTKSEWCRKWDVPLWEYTSYLHRYERKHGKIATPEIRAEWDREYWEKM